MKREKSPVPAQKLPGMSAITAELAWAIREFQLEQLLDPHLLNHTRPINPNDSFKIEKIIQELIEYLTKLSDSLERIQDRQLTMDQFFEGRPTLIQVLAVLSQLDSFVSMVLLLPPVVQNPKSLANLKNVSLLQVDAKQLLLELKRRTDIAGNYKEIKDHMIYGLSEEVERCFSKLEALKADFPPRTAIQESISLEDIISKMRVAPATTPGSYSVRSVLLPIFEEAQRASHSEISNLEGNIDPIHVSMEFLEQRVNDFSTMCSTIFPRSALAISHDFGSLRRRWESLLQNFLLFKQDTADSSWNSLFTFIVSDLESRINAMVDEFLSENRRAVISDEFGTGFKLCSNTVTLVHKAFKEDLFILRDLLVIYNQQVLPRWDLLNALLLGESLREVSGGSEAFRQLKTSRNFTPQASVFKSENESPSGSGIDFGLDINPSPTVPYSISKTDRIVDLSIDPDLVPKHSMRLALLAANQDAFEDDTDTLVHVAPNEIAEDTSEKEHADLKLRPLLRSYLPRPVRNFRELKLPVIKKMFTVGYKPTRIPAICATHPVFLSPTHEARPWGTSEANLSPKRQAMMHNPYESPYKSTLRSPVRLRSPPVFKLDHNRRVSWDDVSVELGLSRNSPVRASSTKISMATTPNLTYGYLRSPDSASLRSTSPERPESSLGSRYDERNLTQTIKITKRQWK